MEDNVRSAELAQYRAVEFSACSTGRSGHLAFAGVASGEHGKLDRVLANDWQDLELRCYHGAALVIDIDPTRPG